MGCLLQSIFKFTLVNLLKMGLPVGEYFQVHPYKSIEDGLPMGEYFQVHPYKSIEDGLPIGRVFSSSPL